MASLSPPFILCPLPDRKTLLGIRPDREPNKAIITLGRNIAIRYHVLEQKQECTWTTSRYWFTSPVTYCYDYGKYGAILNHNIIALWDEGDSSLSTMSKLKLPETALGLHSSQKGRTVLVMKNGHVASLSDISEDKNRVKIGVLGPEEGTLVNFEVDEKKGFCYLASRKMENENLLSLCATGVETDRSSLRCSVGSDKHDILGYCISAQDSDSYVAYFEKSQEMDESECFRLANLSKSISNKNPVVMCPLPDNSCIAMYGSDPSEEGAVVIIYDIHYDLIVSKQSLKLFSVPPLMERIGNSLFVPLGLHILVLTFRVTKSLLSSVVGKHQAKLNEEVFEGRNPWATDGWETTLDVFNEVSQSDSRIEKNNLEDIKKTYPKIWETIQQVQIFESEGQPEAVICNHVIPAALEKDNGTALDWILSTFLDIPEVHIVSMVVFSLKEISNVENDKMNDRLNKLLLRKFDKSLLTLSLRHVAYDDIKKLLNYINNLIKNQWQFYIDVEEESPMQSWLKWCSTLIDAHYTKFVLHNDTRLIENMLVSLSECTQIMKEVEDMEPFLLMTYSKTSFEPATHTLKRWRTETVTFE